MGRLSVNKIGVAGGGESDRDDPSGVHGRVTSVDVETTLKKQTFS